MLAEQPRHRSRSSRTSRPRSRALGCYRRQDEAIRTRRPRVRRRLEVQARAALDPRGRPAQRHAAHGAEPARRRRSTVRLHARRLPAARRRDQLQAARAQDDRVLPRRSPELRRRRHAEPPRVRPGLLRQAGRRRRRLQADRAPLQDAGLRSSPRTSASRRRSAAGRRRPTRSRCRRRRRSSTSRCPTTAWTCASTRTNHGVAAAEVGAASSGSRPSRSSASTGTSKRSAARRATCTRAAARRAGRRGLTRACAASPASSHLRDGAPAAERATRSLRMAGALTPPRPRRVRALPRRARGPRAHAAVDHRPRDRPAAARRTRTRRSWIVFNGEIFNYVELRAELDGARPPLPHAQRHRGHRARLRGVGRRAPSSASTASGRSRSGTRRARRLVLARDRLGVRPLYLCEHGGRLLLRQRGEGDLRRRSGDPARARSRRASTQTFTFWTRRAAAERVRGIEELRAGPRAHLSSTARVRERAYWKPRYPDAHATARSRARSRTPSTRCASALEQRHARCACCAPTCRSAATSPAGSTARSSPRSAARYAGERFQTFSLRFEDAEYDETALPAR